MKLRAIHQALDFEPTQMHSFFRVDLQIHLASDKGNPVRPDSFLPQPGSAGKYPMDAQNSLSNPNVDHILASRRTECIPRSHPERDRPSQSSPHRLRGFSTVDKGKILGYAT